MSTTFRELFDEDEREEIFLALNARLSSLKSRFKRADTGTEQASNVVTLARLEVKIIRLERMIRTVCDESN